MSDHDSLLRAWAGHLRAGGTTPWRAFSAADTTATPAPDSVAVTAGAAQLEVVRRLAQRRDSHAVAPEVFATLADRVLATSGPGRGLPQLPVVRQSPVEIASGRGAVRVGPPPADPARVPAEELVRVLTGVLPALLAEAPTPSSDPARPRDPRRWARLRRPTARFRLAGPPQAVAVVRAALVAAGAREGGRWAPVLVLGLPLEEMLAQAWSLRVQRGSATRWFRFWSRWAGDRLPVSVDLPGLATHHAAAGSRVHVLLAASCGQLVPTATAALGLPARPAPADLPGLDAAAVDLLRRTNRVAGVTTPADERLGLATTAAAHLRRPGSTVRLRVPEQFRGAAAGRSARVATDLTAGAARGTYAVSGDLDVLGVVDEDLPQTPDPAVVLDRALDLTLALVTGTEEER
ncbi:MAG: hypothetical protein Q8Q02_12325 [Nocardioides sp.]|nr:hypothetical protein [Nocardioides sp.]